MTDRITATECAAIAGVALRTWHAYAARGRAPEPVEHVGRTPLWDRAAVIAWQEGRPGQGARLDLGQHPGRGGMTGGGRWCACAPSLRTPATRLHRGARGTVRSVILKGAAQPSHVADSGSPGLT